MAYPIDKVGVGDLFNSLVQVSPGDIAEQPLLALINLLLREGKCNCFVVRIACATQQWRRNLCTPESISKSIKYILKANGCLSMSLSCVAGVDDCKLWWLHAVKVSFILIPGGYGPAHHFLRQSPSQRKLVGIEARGLRHKACDFLLFTASWGKPAPMACCWPYSFDLEDRATQQSK